MPLLRRIVLFALLAGSPLLAAQELPLYEGEVAVTSQDAAERAAALPKALAQVFVKLTGNAAAAQEPALRSALADANRLMQQFRYRQDTVSGNGMRLVLVARFERAGVDALLAAAGVPVWPEPRPAPLVWLAIDDGRGWRLVSNEQASAVVALTRRARDRGMKLLFPLLDVQDQNTVPLAEVLNSAGNDRLLAMAAERYQTPALLVGTMKRDEGTWRAAWRVVEQGKALRRWQYDDPDPTRLLAAAADGAADVLANRFARPLLVSTVGDFSITVTGIENANDYFRALHYLRGLSVVRSAEPAAADNERLQLQLRLATTPEGFSRVLAAGGILEPVNDSNAVDSDAVFHLNP